MKNLKKVLALVLAFAMAFTMVISATAFTDDKAIATDNQEAVNVMSALGVLKGYQDGSFNPAGDVTRAEMAKMIYVIRSGGSDDASAYANVPTTFTDLGAASWASGYIKYCQTMGIIAGKSATQFDPNGKVTMAETAKMALVVLGYKADKAGLTGATWLNKTLSLATENDLMIDTKGAVTAAASRQEAAQVLRNMLDADCVVWSNDIDDFAKDSYTVKGGDKEVYDGGYKYLGLQKWTGTYMGDENSYSCADGEVCVKGHIEGTSNSDVEANFPGKFDNTAIGQKVTVLFKDAKDGTVGRPDKKDSIYGMYLTEDTTSFSKIADDIDDDATNVGKVIIDDVKYKIADKGTITKNYDDSTETTWSTKADGQAKIIALKATNSNAVKFIMNDNSEITAVYVVEYKMAKVTSITSEKITLSNVGSFEIKENNNSVETGLAKDDVVVVTKLYDIDNDDATFTVAKAKTVSGELTAYESKKVTVDGTKYDLFDKKLVDLTDDAITSPDDDTIGDKVTVYLVGGWAFAMNADEEDMKNYAVVTDVEAGTKLDTTFNKAQVELKLADGTKKTVYLHKDSKLYNDGTDKWAVSGDLISTFIKTGDLVKYSTPSETEYKITEIGSTAKPAQLLGTGSVVYNKDPKTFAGTVTASDCVLFVKKGTDWYTYKVRGLDDVTVKTGAAYSYYVKDGKVVAAYAALDRKPSGSSNAVYAIVDKNNGRVKVDGDYYNEYIAYDKANTKYTLHDDALSVSKGALISFEPTSDGTYSSGDVTVYNKSTDTSYKADGYVAGWAKEYESKETLTIYTQVTEVTANKYYTADKNNIKVLAVDNDVAVVYVNVDGHCIGDDIGIGEFDSATGYKNVLAVMDEDAEKVVAIFVETSKKCDIFGDSNSDADRNAIGVVNLTDVTFNAGGIAGLVAPANITTSAASVAGATVDFVLTAAGCASSDKYYLNVTNGAGTNEKLTGKVDATAGTVTFTYTLKSSDQTKTVSAASVLKPTAVTVTVSAAGYTFKGTAITAKNYNPGDVVSFQLTKNANDLTSGAAYVVATDTAGSKAVSALDVTNLSEFTYAVTGSEAGSTITIDVTGVTAPNTVGIALDGAITKYTLVSPVAPAVRAKGSVVTFQLAATPTNEFKAGDIVYVYDGSALVGRTTVTAEMEAAQVVTFTYTVTGTEGAGCFTIDAVSVQ